MWKQDVDYMLTSVLTEIDFGDIYFFCYWKSYHREPRKL